MSCHSVTKSDIINLSKHATVCKDFEERLALEGRNSECTDANLCMKTVLKSKTDSICDYCYYLKWHCPKHACHLSSKVVGLTTIIPTTCRYCCD